MTKRSGFYPEPLRIDAGPVSIRPLANLEAIVESVFAADEVEDGWIYAQPQQTRDVMSGEVRTVPYSALVFGLSRTHVIEHAAATGEDHLDFHVWSLSFFSRLTQVSLTPPRSNVEALWTSSCSGRVWRRRWR